MLFTISAVMIKTTRYFAIFHALDSLKLYLKLKLSTLYTSVQSAVPIKLVLLEKINNVGNLKVVILIMR